MSQQKTGNYRWVVVALLFFATTINYLDRQVLSYLKPTLEKEFGWDDVTYGYINMVFILCYAFGLLLSGRLIDKIGTKLGYIISITVWSIAAMLHALAKGSAGFMWFRGLLGLGESGNFPAAIRSIAEWFPKKERALATGVMNSGTNIGAVAAPIVIPLLLGLYGWQSAFIVTGAIGFIWLIFWVIFYEVPTKKKNIDPAELALIHEDTVAETLTDTRISWGQLFRYKQTWAFFIGKFLTDPIWYFFLTWLPDYFNKAFQLDLKKPTLPLIIIYTATTIGSIGGGYISSYLIKKGWTPVRARKTSMLVFALCVVPIVSARYATDIWQAVALISLAAAAHQAWSANLYTAVSDNFPKTSVSSVIGIGGMAGSLSGAAFPVIVGYVLVQYTDANKHIGYNLIFLFCGMAYLLAWIINHFLMRNAKAV
ncbi:MFS transporter [Mucilaginibacter hurinus]|uniref:MFS transporter n=1 Tax=Mucilaginibacter hurinus TaxID=2201324 RepID=A0A367GVG6_9SPHI|nr:MFS transporter [Mucilaginibacter hurinus]RCH56791.1 MFS transporter [Mucilaginibacter hurinus]